MDARTASSQIVAMLLVVIVISLLVGHLLGQPVLLSYVETGSMAPTLEPGDGFIAIPAAIAGPVETGDVVTWRAERLHGGGLVTHRVVGETNAGFITRGDANPFTDQESSENEPPVREEQVIAKALQVDGNVVVLPKIGLFVIWSRGITTAVQQQLAILLGTRAGRGTQGLSYIVFGIGVATYVLSVLFGESSGSRPTRSRKRDTGLVDTRLVVVGLTAILVVLVTASMTAPGGTQQFGVVSSDTDAPGARVIQKGTTEQTTYFVPSNGIVPVQVFLEPSGENIDVTPRELYVPGGEQRSATVTLTAPPETGYYRSYLTEYRYLAVLPRPVIRGLFAIHPWVPIMVIDALLSIGFLAAGFALVGFGPVRNRTRKSPTTLYARVTRWLR